VPSTTVIDRLLVSLGLDTRDFTKGEKTVAAATLDLERKTKASANGMSAGLGKLAARWLTVAAAITAVKKVVSVIDDAAESTRKLGIDAQNYDIAASRLRNFENAVQMMGGSAEEARKTVAGFQRSIFDLAYNGQVSDSLMMLARLGVQFQTATGEARNFNDVVLDTADAIQTAQAQGMSRSNAFQFLQQAGFDQGTAQLILSGRANIEAEQGKQEQRFQVTPGALKGAEDTNRSAIDFEQQAEALKVKGLEVGAGSAQNFVRDLIAHPSTALDHLSDAATHAGTALEDWALKATGVSRGMRNNNPGNIRALKGQKADRHGFRVYDTMEEGIKAARHQLALYESRGLTTAQQAISTWAPPNENDTAAYIKEVEKSTGIKPGEDIRGQEDLLLSGMFRHESGPGAPSVQDIADINTMQDDVMDSPAAPGIQGGTTYNKTDVHIDNIEVKSPAADAPGLADDLDDALSRKLLASHAETGMK
jgi:hypothetical protein